MFYFRPWRLSHDLGKLDHSAGSTTSRTSTTKSFTSSTASWSQKIGSGGSNGAFFMMGAWGVSKKVRCWNWSFEIGWNWLFPVFFDQLPMFSQKHGLVMVLSTTKLWPVGTYTLMPASTVWIPCWSTHADWGYFKHYNLSLQDVFEIYRSNENRAPGSLGYVGDYTTYIYYIPSCLGIIS